MWLVIESSLSIKTPRLRTTESGAMMSAPICRLRSTPCKRWRLVLDPNQIISNLIGLSCSRLEVHQTWTDSTQRSMFVIAAAACVSCKWSAICVRQHRDGDKTHVSRWLTVSHPYTQRILAGRVLSPGGHCSQLWKLSNDPIQLGRSKFDQPRRTDTIWAPDP